jgi:hypothetical protein
LEFHFAHDETCYCDALGRAPRCIWWRLLGSRAPDKRTSPLHDDSPPTLLAFVGDPSWSPPKSRSPVVDIGLWQLMEAVSKKYVLDRDWSVPHEATRRGFNASPRRFACSLLSLLSLLQGDDSFGSPDIGCPFLFFPFIPPPSTSFPLLPSSGN